MGWKDTLTEKARDRIVTGLFALITLLLLAIYRAMPAAVWDKVSEATPKRVLWALVALELIVIGLLAAFAIDERRKRKNAPPLLSEKTFRRFGVHWDEHQNPLCPVCEILLSLRASVIENSAPEYLQCPKCRNAYTLKSDHGAWISLALAKATVKRVVTKK
jgi:hypothetical protein